VFCKECEDLLETCRQQDGWFQAKKIRARLAALACLEKDGFLESRSDGIQSTTYWKVLETKEDGG
jgi:hypothetical protein